MKLTKLTLIDEEELLEFIWDAYYRSDEDQGHVNRRKSEDKIPQVVQDVVKMFYKILDAEIGRGETRHLLPLDATADHIQATKRRVRAALERALDREALHLTPNQPKRGKRYGVNPKLVMERRVNITSAWELRQHCAEQGMFDLYWEAYKTVRQTRERASLKAIIEEMESLEAKGFGADKR